MVSVLFPLKSGAKDQSLDQGSTILHEKEDRFLHTAEYKSFEFSSEVYECSITGYSWPRLINTGTVRELEETALENGWDIQLTMILLNGVIGIWGIEHYSFDWLQKYTDQTPQRKAPWHILYTPPIKHPWSPTKIIFYSPMFPTVRLRCYHPPIQEDQITMAN